MMTLVARSCLAALLFTHGVTAASALWNLEGVANIPIRSTAVPANPRFDGNSAALTNPYTPSPVGGKLTYRGFGDAVGIGYGFSGLSAGTYSLTPSHPDFLLTPGNSERGPRCGHDRNGICRDPDSRGARSAGCANDGWYGHDFMAGLTHRVFAGTCGRAGRRLHPGHDQPGNR
jgi:hypothetical protein